MGEFITETAVVDATGKSWTEWYAEIEGSPIKHEGLASVTTWLTEQHADIGGWWCQVIARRWDSERSLLSASK